MGASVQLLVRVAINNFWKFLLGEGYGAIRSGGHKMIMAKQELQELGSYINDASFLVAAGVSNPERFRNWISEAQKAAFCLEDQIAMYAIQGCTDSQLYHMKSDIGMFSIRKLTEMIQDHKRNMPGEVRSSENMAQLSKISPFIRYSHPVSAGPIIGMGSAIEKVEEFLTGAHPVLFIIGGQGSGKTTLMKHVYEKTHDNFNPRYWVDIEKTGGLVGLLKKMLEGSTVDPDAIDEFEILKTIHGIFQGKHYLIVLDDVQDTCVLYSLKHVLKDFKGKIICLTRRRDIQDTSVRRGDIQDTSALHSLKYVLKVFKVKIMCLTRRRDTQDTSVLYISGLEPYDSRMLLMHAAFPNFDGNFGDDVFRDAVMQRALNSPLRSLPADELGTLVDTLNVILSKCQGNPWNIWTIGTLLEANPFEKWSEIGERIDGMLIGDTMEQRDPPIQLEDAKLPPAIRDSFLYCLAFPEKSEIPENSGIPTRKLIRLWMAEGYLQDSPRQSQEQEAEDLLQELIRKKLLVVKKKSFDGEVLKCSVNEHIRPLALKMCEYQKFCRFVPDDGDEASLPSRMAKCFPTPLNICTWRKRPLLDRHRMLAVHGDQGVKEASEILRKDIRLRSLLHFKTGRMEHSKLELSFQRAHKLLRTLELQGTRLARLPSSIGCLVCLRYLGLRNTQLEDLPPTLQRLRHLMCLDIRDTNIAEVADVSRFTEMRHLYLTNSFRSQSVLIREGLQSLIHLQTLSGAAHREPSGRQSSGMVSFEEEISHLKCLRKLSIKRASSTSSRNICDAINGMDFLQSLAISCDRDRQQFDVSPLKIGKNLRKLKLGGPMGNFCVLGPMMQSITYLYLWDSKLPVDLLDTLQGLKNLLVLSLLNASTSEKMSCDNGYEKLKKLSIISMENLSGCEFGSGTMRNLEELVFAKCGNLKSPPPGLDQLGSLREVHLTEMLPDFCKKTKDKLKDKVYVLPDTLSHVFLKNPFHMSSRSATGGS